MRARGVEPLLLTMSDARTDSIGGMEKKKVSAPFAVRNGPAFFVIREAHLAARPNHSTFTI